MVALILRVIQLCFLSNFFLHELRESVQVQVPNKYVGIMYEYEDE